jgi:predicted dehydrogenase
MSTYKSAQRPLNMGVLGGANIARQFIRDVRPSTQVRVSCVASRAADKASEFAAANGVARRDWWPPLARLTAPASVLTAPASATDCPKCQRWLP